MHCKTSCDSIGASTLIYRPVLPAIADRQNGGKSCCLALPARLRRNCLQFVGKLDCFQPPDKGSAARSLFCLRFVFGFFNFFPEKKQIFAMVGLRRQSSSSKERLAPQYLRLASAIWIR